jgi:hypothetical protein
MDNKSSIHANSDQFCLKLEQSPDAHVKAAHIKTQDSNASKGKYSRSRQKHANSAKSTALNKKSFVSKFVKDTKSLVWPREMKIVNTLYKTFPNDSFWESLELKFKLNSLCWFLSDEGRKFLNSEYKKFKFEPEKPETFELKNNNIAFEGKIGETIQAPMTVREFLNLWQKKS